MPEVRTLGPFIQWEQKKLSWKSDKLLELVDWKVPWSLELSTKKNHGVQLMAEEGCSLAYGSPSIEGPFFPFVLLLLLLLLIRNCPPLTIYSLALGLQK